MAIHCEPVNEETSRPRRSRHDGLRRRSLTLSPRNDKSVYGHRTAHSIPYDSLSSRGLKARGDPL